jgi:hypothetical protein
MAYILGIKALGLDPAKNGSYFIMQGVWSQPFTFYILYIDILCLTPYMQLILNTFAGTVQQLTAV